MTPNLKIAALDFDTLAALAGTSNVKDVACPLCGPDRPTRQRQDRKVLRIWRKSDDCITFACVRCNEHGWVSDRNAKPIDKFEVGRRMREANRAAEENVQHRRRKASWLWDKSRPIAGTVAELYLRSRSIELAPPMLRFLPANNGHAAAMVAAFAVPQEAEPGAYDEGVVPSAVHLTALNDNGGKIDKRMIGPTADFPIALIPPNDLGGLVIAEGIEDALTVAQQAGLGAWAAGAACRLPKLVKHIVSATYIEAVTILVDDDDAGRRGAHDLARALAQLRGGTLDVRECHP